MFSSISKVVIARENMQNELSENEQLAIAPPDVQLQDSDIQAEVMNDDTQQLSNDIQQAITDSEEVGSIADKFEEADEITPEALMIAQESLKRIYSKYDLDVRSFSKESAKCSTKQTAKELISQARERQVVIRSLAQEGLRELYNRFAVWLRMILRFKTTYQKKANQLIKIAEAITTEPRTDVEYDNIVRIARVCDSDKNPITDTKDLLNIFKETTQAISEMSNGAVRMFTAVSEKKDDFSAVIDFDKMFGNLRVVGHSHGEELYSTTAETLYGEGIYFVEVPRGKIRNRADLFQALKNFDTESVKFWTIKDLGNMTLPVMPSQQVIENCQNIITLVDEVIQSGRNIEDLEELSDQIKNQSKETKKIGNYEVEVDTEYGKSIKINPDLANVIKFINRVVIYTLEGNDRKIAAIGCLLDYYEWSLKNHYRL